ncbi:hypothetical protein C8E01_102340 [Pontibacter virosus]|uniref:Uncharacterized protein n=1 Tax=Pontibacter virosus TaxID=1765052 RepID=A0A2U1B3C7_9BACT|nr:hypothetical protein C8E01_102340 [Pontibacter virosus]
MPKKIYIIIDSIMVDMWSGLNGKNGKRKKMNLYKLMI